MKTKILAFVLLLMCMLTGCSEDDIARMEAAIDAYEAAESTQTDGKNPSEKTQSVDDKENKTTVTTDANGTLTIRVIDVGQADSILIQTPDNRNMLIDAGETKKNSIKDALNDAGVDKFDIVVATHPHYDHISEMPQIINEYEIDRFYMPGVAHTSKTFEKMADALDERDVDTYEAKAGISDELV